MSRDIIYDMSKARHFLRSVSLISFKIIDKRQPALWIILPLSGGLFYKVWAKPFYGQGIRPAHMTFNELSGHISMYIRIESFIKICKSRSFVVYILWDVEELTFFIKFCYLQNLKINVKEIALSNSFHHIDIKIWL